MKPQDSNGENTRQEEKEVLEKEAQETVTHAAGLPTDGTSSQLEQAVQETDYQSQCLQVQQALEAITQERDQLQQERETLQKDLEESKDKYIRLYADFENFRKRATKERLELIQSASEDLMKTILPVVDDFERAIRSAENTDNVQALTEGIKIIYHKFYKALEQKGLRPMKVNGEAFNMDIHEAITEIPAPAEELRGKVVDEIERGYYLHDKLIRIAKVVVGS
jgi:molecular chaperone GrpE